ncbi:MAG: hypothetical protein WA188_15460 [Terriglobales bacterium]
MKTCKCGKQVASNARVCPGCGHRFTHPFVMFLAAVLGIILVMAFFGAVIGPSTSTTVPTPAPAASPTIATNPQATKLATVLSSCGKPDRDYTKKAADGVTEMRTLRYGQTELIFLRDKRNPTWMFGNTFIVGRDDDIGSAAASKRMPCVKGGLHSIID